MAKRHPSFPRPAVLAHRMLALGYPENTVLSLKAVSTLCDWVEFDAWEAADGVLVSMHDARVDRTTDGSGLVRELTWDELSRLNAGKGYPFGFVPVPRVADVLEALEELRAQGRVIRAEVHVHDLEDFGALFDLFDDYGAREYCYANLNVMGTAIHVREDLGDDGALLSLNVQGDGPGLLDFCREYDVAYLCVKTRAVQPRFVEKVHEAGLFVHTYPVNDEEEMARVVNAGADVVQTDYVEVLREVLEGMGYSVGEVLPSPTPTSP
ncbi:MAG: glycerophosphodiester phosphodiesterase [Promethearchaeota archaeon]